MFLFYLKGISFHY